MANKFLMPKLVRTFFDTGVILRAFTSRFPDTTDLALALVTDPQREIVVSSLLALELYPSANFRQDMDEIALLDEFFALAAHRVEVDETFIEATIKEASRIYGIKAMDAAHLTAAKLAGCSEFITAEQPTKPLYHARGIKVIQFP